MALNCSPESGLMKCLQANLFGSGSNTFFIETDFLCTFSQGHYVENFGEIIGSEGDV